MALEEPEKRLRKRERHSGEYTYTRYMLYTYISSPEELCKCIKTARGQCQGRNLQRPVAAAFTSFVLSHLFARYVTRS